MRAQILSVADRGEQARCHAEGGGRNAVHCGSPNEFILSFRVTLSTKQHFEAGFVLGCINEPIIAPFSPKTMENHVDGLRCLRAIVVPLAYSRKRNSSS